MVLDVNGIWELVLPPPDRKAIGCKWVFTVNLNLDGAVACVRARLVTKGYAQIYKIDYFDIFSLIAKFAFVCLFISLVTTHNWPLY